MGYDVLKRRCAHNKILGKLEQCELCVASERERAKEKAGPKRNMLGQRKLEYPETLRRRPTHPDAWTCSVAIPRQALEPTNYERESQALIARMRRSIDDVLDQASSEGLLNEEALREANLESLGLHRFGVLGLVPGQEFTTGMTGVIGVVRHVNEDGSCLVEMGGDVVEQDPDPLSHVGRLFDRIYGGKGA